MAQLGTGETGSRSEPERFCLFVTPIVAVGLSSFLCLLLLFFEKGFKILATQYSEFWIRIIRMGIIQLKPIMITSECFGLNQIRMAISISILDSIFVDRLLRYSFFAHKTKKILFFYRKCIAVIAISTYITVQCLLFSYAREWRATCVYIH